MLFSIFVASGQLSEKFFQFFDIFIKRRFNNIFLLLIFQPVILPYKCGSFYARRPKIRGFFQGCPVSVTYTPIALIIFISEISLGPLLLFFFFFIFRSAFSVFFLNF